VGCPCQSFGFQELHHGPDADNFLTFSLDLFRQSIGIPLEAFGLLDFNRQNSHMFLFRDYTRIFTREIAVIPDNSFDITGKDIDAFYNHHVVQSAVNPVQTQMRPPTIAWLGGIRDDVAGAETDQGTGDFFQRSQDQFPAFSFRNFFTGVWIDNFREDMIFGPV